MKSFVFYETFYENIKHIKNDKLKLEVLCRILEYGLYETPLDVSDIDDIGVLTSVAEYIKCSIDRSKANRQRVSEIRRENGKKGGGQIGNQNARKHNISEAGERDSDYDNPDSEDLEKNEQKRAKRVKRVKRVVDVDVDVDVDEKEKNIISDDIIEKSAKKEVDKSPKKPKADYQKIVDMWHEICKSLSKVTKISDKRKRYMDARMAELNWDYEELRKTLIRAEKSKRENKREWMTFDWIFKAEDNMLKVSEGNYDNAFNDGKSGKSEFERMNLHPNGFWENFDFDPTNL